MSRLCTIFVLTCLVAPGCANDGGNPQLRIELVDPEGENPASRIIEGRLRVRVRQGESSLPCADRVCETEIRSGDFDLSLPIESFVALTTIQVEIEGGGELLLGAVPPFAVALESLETGMVPVRIVMMPPGPPGVCARIELDNISTEGSPRLVAPRRDMAAVVRRNFVLLVGGIEESGAESVRTDFFDQVVVGMRPPLESAPDRLGAARGIALDEDHSLVVGVNAFVWVRPAMGPPVVSNVDLHPGADFSSALVQVGLETAVIGGTGTASVTWLDERGRTIATRALTAPRAFAAAAAGEEGALVVGGGVGGEWIERGVDVPVRIDDVPSGSGGWLAASPTRRTFLWIGAHGTDTTVITGCPSACTVGRGPSWERARDGASGVRTAAGTFWIVGGDGSSMIDRVLWDGEVPRIASGPTLAEARAGAALAEHVSGIVLVIGGEGSDRMRDDVEMCMPDTGLDPI